MSYVQGFLPIFNAENKMVLGMYAITQTTFNGTETTFALADGTVNIGLVTPQKSLLRPNVPYMAALPTHTEVFQGTYKGHAAFIPIDDVLPSSTWINSPWVFGLNYVFDGALIHGLKYGLQSSISVPTPPAPSIGSPSSSLTWSAAAPFSNAPAYKFFDFNWVSVFEVDAPDSAAASIIVTSQPSGGAALRAVLIQGAETVLNGIQYNTIRIMKVSNTPLATGTYNFGFNVIDQNGNSTAVTLAVTVN